MKQIVVHAELLGVLHSFGMVPDYESILERDYRRLIRPGDTVVDVGAHSGRHTAIFCELVGPTGVVLAFEPLPIAFAALEARAPSACLVNAALGDHSGKSHFTFARGTPEESGLRQKAFNSPENADPVQIEVDVMRLDDFLPELPSLRFLKVDVEGGEIQCLRGAEQVLRQFRPFVSVEYGAPGYAAYGHTSSTLFDFAIRQGYVLGNLFGAHCDDAETWDRVCDRSFWDYFMVPRERVEEWHATFGAS